MFNKILVANRGEIALRVLRACKELGIRSVVVFSDADSNSLHVKYADEKVNIGHPITRKSYLNSAKILQVAKEKGVDAIHPGYGFLAENASFARACEENGIRFIGPSSDCISLAGDKAKAREVVRRAGVPVIPGSSDSVRDENEAVDVAREIGYPVMLKASGGGGGRGMRIANNDDELRNEYRIASGEARVAFGNPNIYVEKYLEKPRHIEIQILCDEHGNCIHLGERECSVQRRYQKVVEEAPSPFVDDELRKKMAEAAITVALAIGYQNAGTIEFLVDSNRNFYFMEVNARIQVEHPVTELVTGFDIVQEQIRIAAGEGIRISQSDVILRGHAIECRINAEDPNNDFMPSPGRIEELILPGGPGVRVDTHIYEGYEVPPFYDSLLCKLIVWAENRDMAIKRMSRALSEFYISGVEVTISFLKKLFSHPDFIAGDIDTHFLNRMS